MELSEDRKLLNVAEVANFVGCAQSTIWRWVADSQFPKPIRLGCVTRWDSAEVLAFIAAAKQNR